MEERPSGETSSEPGPAPHDVLGRVPTGRSLWYELAAAARSRGVRSSVTDAIVETHAAIERIDVPTVDLVSARRRVAAATGEEERLKERVAAARGDVRGRRAVDAPVKAATAKLETAAAELSTAQTERIAAEQALERERERAVVARDARERRLRLRDRLENRKREARIELARAVYPTFRGALEAVPMGDPYDAGREPGDYAGPDLAASLAAIRIADLEGPVTLSDRARHAFVAVPTSRSTRRVPNDEAAATAERVLGVPIDPAGDL